MTNFAGEKMGGMSSLAGYVVERHRMFMWQLSDCCQDLNYLEWE